MSVLANGMRSLGGRSWYPRVGPLLAPLDRALGVLTKGRYVALGLKEIPSCLITTVGRTTGRPRTNPLLYAPDGDAFVVVGSNFGQPFHPGWVLNLFARPEATVTAAGRRIAVHATVVTGEERERYWHSLTAIWPAYDVYQHRVTQREFVVFRLSPTADGASVE